MSALSFRLGIVGIAVAVAGLAAQAPRSQAPAATSGGAAGPAVAVLDLSAASAALSAAAGEDLDVYRSRRLAELDQLRDKVRAFQKQILDGGDALKPETREELIQAVRRGQAELRQAELEAQRDVQVRADLQQAAVRDYISRAAAARNVQLVLDQKAAAVLYYAPSVDLTADVVALVKQASPKRRE